MSKVSPVCFGIRPEYTTIDLVTNNELERIYMLEDIRARNNLLCSFQHKRSYKVYHLISSIHTSKLIVYAVIMHKNLIL